MDFLAKLFGKTEDGQPEALTYDQLKAKIEADKGLKIVNLSDGGYVSKDKFDAANTEVNGYKKQLEDAQKEIKSYKDMDIDGIKASAAEYESKSKEQIAQLEKQLADQKLEFAEDKFLSQYKFSDDFAKAGVRGEFRSKQFKYDEATGKFLGAEEYMKEIMESHKGAFVIEEATPENENEEKGDSPEGKGSGNQPPVFLGKDNGQKGADTGVQNPFGFNFLGVRPHETK